MADAETGTPAIDWSGLGEDDRFEVSRGLAIALTGRRKGATPGALRFPEATPKLVRDYLDVRVARTSALRFDPRLRAALETLAAASGIVLPPEVAEPTPDWHEDAGGDEDESAVAGDDDRQTYDRSPAAPSRSSPSPSAPPATEAGKITPAAPVLPVGESGRQNAPSETAPGERVEPPAGEAPQAVELDRGNGGGAENDGSWSAAEDARWRASVMRRIGAVTGMMLRVEEGRQEALRENHALRARNTRLQAALLERGGELVP